ncbi:hypothetical protein BIV57_20020 [Mangrovactinospora gilvigrisea]|uniref:Uncharacterized protein n=1 Tax=Mangrovactinospora gilvigrisea TaxID=1428644 RepID=A0A1J7C7Z6_9ACTN|nr:hypothetical protein [Mangrovactinospora gilvigrisea]OIV35762.1 hypothetical protein BIV57_20020 [Mangrovactinospora gilvigrisea]
MTWAEDGRGTRVGVAEPVTLRGLLLADVLVRWAELTGRPAQVGAAVPAELAARAAALNVRPPGRGPFREPDTVLEAGPVTGRGYRTAEPLPLRMVLLGHRPAQQVDLTEERLAEAAAEAAAWRRSVAEWADSPSRPVPDAVRGELVAALEDGLDTPRVLRMLRRLADDPTAPPGARFEAFAFTDRVLALDLTSEIGRW